jgi:hypothetical protein
MPKKLDLTNQIFGIIKCISPAQSVSGKTYWNCECIRCGFKKVIQTSHLTQGKIKTCSCGCLLEEKEEYIRKCEICEKEFKQLNNKAVRKYCYDCAPCENKEYSRSEAVTIKRRAIKNMLIKYAGGECKKCGYNKCIRALEFHHLDPNEKDFGISKCLTKSISSLKEEVDKCILVCSNCHAEIHQELFEQGYQI